MSNYKTKLHNIKAFAYDVDGVFTDGGVMATESGDLIRVFDSKDGFGVRLTVLKGYKNAIITGGTSESIRKRFKGLGIPDEDVYLKDFRNHFITPDLITFRTERCTRQMR